jgi:hypothetical protein
MHKRLYLIPLLTALLLLAVGHVSAQEDGPVTATLSAPQDHLTVGDSIRLTLAVTHPAGYQVILPVVAPAWGDFMVVSQSPATTTASQYHAADFTANAGGTETTTATIDARLFQPGAFHTPPLEVSVTDGQGGLQKVTAAPVAVTIAAVLQKGDTELRDIKPQAALPIATAGPWLAAGLAAVAALASLIVWRTRRRLRVAVDNRLPHEVALDGLVLIEGLRLPEQGRFKEHYTFVSDTVRTYMERRYGVPALERTTGEIRPDLARIELSPELTAVLIAFLQESDLVKFSDHRECTPDVASAYELLAQGRLIVETTRPAPVSPPQGAPDHPKASRRPRRMLPGKQPGLVKDPVPFGEVTA